jgi:hypothetical protein
VKNEVVVAVAEKVVAVVEEVVELEIFHAVI